MTLRARLAAFIAVSVGIAVAVIAFAAYGFAADEARDEVDDFLKRRGPVFGIVGTGDVEEFRNRGGRGPGPNSGLLGLLDDVIREDAIAQFVDTAGGVVTIGLSPTVLPVDDRDLEIAALGGPDYFRDETVDGVHYRMLTRPVASGLAIQVARDVTATDQLLADLRLRLTLLGLGGVVAAAAAGWLVSRRTLRPVGVLTEAAEHVTATQELGARIEVDRDDELGRLASSFNGMLAALEEARSSQRRLVADASHELRTPLTSLRTNIELLARGAVTGAEREELLADLTSEVAELSHLVAEVVDLATVGRHEEEASEIDLAELVTQSVERSRRHGTATIHLELQPTSIDGRPNSLLRAINNLLDNAVKWGGSSGPIDVTLHDRRLDVRDRGPGIPEDDLGHVFERFYRSPASRSLPGSGLGLSIVKAVIDEHGGTVHASNHPDGGAVVGFTLPS